MIMLDDGLMRTEAFGEEQDFNENFGGNSIGKPVDNTYDDSVVDDDINKAIEDAKKTLGENNNQTQTHQDNVDTNSINEKDVVDFKDAVPVSNDDKPGIFTRLAQWFKEGGLPKLFLGTMKLIGDGIRMLLFGDARPFDFNGEVQKELAADRLRQNAEQGQNKNEQSKDSQERSRTKGQKFDRTTQNHNQTSTESKNITENETKTSKPEKSELRKSFDNIRNNIKGVRNLANNLGVELRYLDVEMYDTKDGNVKMPTLTVANYNDRENKLGLALYEKTNADNHKDVGDYQIAKKQDIASIIYASELNSKDGKLSYQDVFTSAIKAMYIAEKSEFENGTDWIAGEKGVSSSTHITTLNTGFKIDKTPLNISLVKDDNTYSVEFNGKNYGTININDLDTDVRKVERTINKAASAIEKDINNHNKGQSKSNNPERIKFNQQNLSEYAITNYNVNDVIKIVQDMNEAERKESEQTQGQQENEVETPMYDTEKETKTDNAQSVNGEPINIEELFATVTNACNDEQPQTQQPNSTAYDSMPEEDKVRLAEAQARLFNDDIPNMGCDAMDINAEPLNIEQQEYDDQTI